MIQTAPAKEPDTAQWIKKQLFYTRLTFLAVLVTAVAVIFFVLRVHTALGRIQGQVDDAAQKLGALMEDAQGVAQDLSVVAGNLKEVDWQQMAGNIDQAAQTAQTSLTDAGEALKKLEALDIDTMNKAIGDLYAVTQPMARLFGR